jgi:hypothetical protein
VGADIVMESITPTTDGATPDQLVGVIA